MSQNQLVSDILTHISKIHRDSISQGINLQRGIQLPDQHISCIWTICVSGYNQNSLVLESRLKGSIWQECLMRTCHILLHSLDRPDNLLILTRSFSKDKTWLGTIIISGKFLFSFQKKITILCWALVLPFSFLENPGTSQCLTLCPLVLLSPLFLSPLTMAIFGSFIASSSQE